MAEFYMPSLGADMVTGILVAWRVNPGDRVTRGDIIAEVETDKGLIDVEVFEDGVVDQLLVQPSDEKIPVGTLLATIRPEGVPPALPTAVAERVPAAPAAAGAARAPAGPPVIPTPLAPAEKRVRVSPLARKLAAERGVDLSTVQGTGPQGAIERADVERAAEAKKPVEELPAPPAPPLPERPPAEVRRPPSDFVVGMRRAIAAAMARSNREIPHYYLETRIEMSRALRWLEAENLKRPIKDRLLPVVLLLKAVARALGDVPELNGYWLDDRHQPQEAVNIGCAISLRQGGLVTPAIHNVDLKSLDELMEALRDLIMRARTGHLRSSEMTDATITVTNLGDMGVEVVYGVIYPPQVALVGFGKIVELPWAENGMLGIRPVLRATLAGDHRATDGHRGGQFLDVLNRYLQEPEKL
ncbi:MAG: 2-oxo acid dehydrogenase subunit E2 [Ardenticatenaceae bacterium]|nr:2-oxo acid dehydrogenase subunit E2 [Ardenticatenaceae bacterium]